MRTRLLVGRDALQGRAHGIDRSGIAGQFLLIADLGSQSGVFASQPLGLGGAGDEMEQLSAVEGLLDEVRSPPADRRNRRVERPVAGNHQHGKVGVVRLQRLEQLQSVQTRSAEPHVQQHERRTPFRDLFQRRIAVGRRSGLVALVLPGRRSPDRGCRARHRRSGCRVPSAGSPHATASSCWCALAASATRSKRRVTSAPPAGERARTIVPACSSTIFLTIGRPRPVPLAWVGHIRLHQIVAPVRKTGDHCRQWPPRPNLRNGEHRCRSPAQQDRRTAQALPTAFLMMFVNACPICRPSHTMRTSSLSVQLQPNRRMRDLLQEHGLSDELGQRLLAKNRLGHPGKGRELVDHAPEVAHLSLDRARQLREGRVLLRQLGAVAAVQPLGGQLDRGQRILDLVRDPTRDVGPRPRGADRPAAPSRRRRSAPSRRRHAPCWPRSCVAPPRLAAPGWRRRRRPSRRSRAPETRFRSG